jgi:hypothetical protein
LESKARLGEHRSKESCGNAKVCFVRGGETDVDRVGRTLLSVAFDLDVDRAERALLSACS